jgi:hypothetical protein
MNDRTTLWNRQIAAIAKTPGYFANAFQKRLGTTDLEKIADHLGYRPTEIERSFIAFEVASSRADFETAAAIEARRKLAPGTLTDLLEDREPKGDTARKSDDRKDDIDTTGDRLGVL